MKVLTERRCRRREKILATARDLLAKHGYVGVTMRELAAKSNVTPKTLYHLKPCITSSAIRKSCCISLSKSDFGIPTRQSVITRSKRLLISFFYRRGGRRIYQKDFTKYEMSLMLSSLTQGYTHQKVTRIVRALQKKLAKHER
ncbi:MAG: TetR/AcrR family transcriptional regulator [Candidatus Azotimanducaceae bacterium WSBS_2022_MAG_OTU7]